MPRPRKNDKPKAKAKGKAEPKAPTETENLTYKQRLFVSYFLGEANGNGTEAARRAGYSCPQQQATENLAKPLIRAAIDAKADEVALRTDEILARLSEQATGSLADFVTITKGGLLRIDLNKAAELGKLHLIKKYKFGQWGPEIELHDPHAALTQLAKYRGILKDRIEVESSDADPLKAELAARALKAMNEGKGDGGN